MDEPQVAISRGLTDEQRTVAAEIFDDAFAAKLQRSIPDREKRVTLFAASLDPANIISASLGGRLVGVAGIKSESGDHVNGVFDEGRMSFRGIASALGYLAAARAVMLLGMFDHKPDPDELYLDAIAVSPAARGHGVGTKLLKEVATVASELGFAKVRLDVVDTNPGARKLYEREGYETIKEQSYGYLRPLLSFGSNATMDLRLEGGVTRSVDEGA